MLPLPTISTPSSRSGASFAAQLVSASAPAWSRRCSAERPGHPRPETRASAPTRCRDRGPTSSIHRDFAPAQAFRATRSASSGRAGRRDIAPGGAWREAAEIVDRPRLRHRRHRGLRHVPVRRHAQDRLRPRDSARRSAAHASCARVLVQRVHRVAVPEEQYWHARSGHRAIPYAKRTISAVYGATKSTRSSAGPRSPRPTASTIIAPRACRCSRRFPTTVSRTARTRRSSRAATGRARSHASTAR